MATPRPRYHVTMRIKEDQLPSCPALPWRDRHLIILGSVALVLRGLVAAVLAKSETPDSGGYLAIAANLLAGRGYSMAIDAPFEPTMYREPLYPLFLAAASVLPGPTVLVAQAMQIVLIAVTCMLTVQLAIGIGASRHVAFGAGWLAALHPTFIMYSGYVMSEALSAFVLTLGLLALVHAWRNGKGFFFLGAGLLLGASILCKTALLLLPLCLAAVFAIFKSPPAVRWFGERSTVSGLSTLPVRSASLAGILIMLLGTALVVVPWSVRNHSVFNTFSVATRGGESLWARAQTLEVSEEEASKRMMRYYSQLLARGLTEPQADAVMGKEAREILARTPGTYLLGNLPQMRQFWVCSGTSDKSAPVAACPTIKCRGAAAVRSLVPLGFSLMAVATLIGMAAMLRRPGVVLVVVLPVVYLTFVHSFFSSTSCRYGVTVLPFALIFLAYGLALFLGAASTAWTRLRVARGSA